jgi:serine/threonine protein kinase
MAAMRVGLAAAALAPRARSEASEVGARLVADGRAGVLDLLPQLEGWSLAGEYVLREAIGAGGQGIVFAASSASSHAVAVKLPLLEYDRPWSYGEGEIGRARARLEREAELLRLLSCEVRLLPTFVDLLRAENPLHEPDRAAAEVGPDPFLVMELVDAPPLVLWLRAQQRAPRASERFEPLLCRAVCDLLRCQERLAVRGLVYTDSKPEHLRLRPDGDGLRLLDAGGISRLDDERGPLAFTPAYAGPAPTGARAAGRRSLARTLYEAWTGRCPAGEAAPSPPGDPDWRGAPAWLAELVARLEAGAESWGELAAMVEAAR